MDQSKYRRAKSISGRQVTVKPQEADESQAIKISQSHPRGHDDAGDLSTSQAKPTVSEIQGLRLIGGDSSIQQSNITQIRSGSDADGNVLLSRVSGGDLFLQKLPRAENSATEPSKIAGYS